MSLRAAFCITLLDSKCSCYSNAGGRRENAKLKKLVAERDLEIEVMKEVAAKKW
jgi:acetone carboxylase gamma subunit